VVVTRVTRGESRDLGGQTRGLTLAEDDSATFVLWRKPEAWLKIHPVSNQLHSPRVAHPKSNESDQGRRIELSE
jgi:hypothetical protein